MSTISNAAHVAADSLDEEADELTRLDSLQGDGDLGRTAGLIAQVLREVAEETGEDLFEFLRSVGTRIASAAPSSSGTLIASGFLSAAKAVSNSPSTPSAALVLRGGIEGIQRRGKAEAGERTMLDALIPALQVLESETDRTSNAAADAAEAGIEATRSMTPKHGRARFLGGNAQGEPDPGAVMVGQALAASLRTR